MRKKYRWLLGILFVAFMIGGLYYFFIYNAVYIRFNAEEKSAFGWMQEDQEHFYCESIIPIKGTPYIFCRFHDNGSSTSLEGNNSYRTLLYRGFLIETSRSVSVLNGEWNATYYKKSGVVMDGEYWYHQKTFAMNKEPVLQFVHTKVKLPFYTSLPFLHLVFNRPKKTENEFFYVDIAGNIETNSDFPEHFFPIAGEDKIVVPKIRGLKEYAFSKNNLSLLNEWDAGSISNSLITLDNGYYFSFDKRKNELYFSSTATPPQTFIFSFNNLYDILPDLEFGDSLFIYSCNQHDRRSPYFYLQEGKWDRCPIVKINSNRIKDGKFNDIFLFCGSIPKEKETYTTVLALNNDQVIISFSPEFDKKNKQFISPSFDVYKPSIIENGDDNRFCEKIKTVEIPFKVYSQAIAALDDQYLLFYGEGALWKMKWDGSEYAKIFPR
jgi:hypothetical protein